MSFYLDTIRKDPRFTSTEVIKDLALLEPGTRAAVTSILADAKAQGVDLRVLETYRSQARQAMLWEEHLTQLRTVGCHGFGIACDLALYEHGEYVSDGSRYGPLWALAKKHGMISGNDWGHGKPSSGFRDPDHIQRCPVWRQGDLFSLRWYPPEIYDPYADMVGASKATDHTRPALQAAATLVNEPDPPAPDFSIDLDNPSLQRALNALGARPQLVVDGDLGKKTEAAIAKFQNAHGLFASGQPDAKTVASIRAALAALPKN